VKSSRKSQASERRPTDLRRLRRDTNRQLLLLVLFVLVVVGGGLIALVYGGPAAILGIACLLAGAGVIVAIWLALSLMGKWAGDEQQ
jgi:protein-S-isoprenylcysteine O-methyltransferase Ste14